MIVVVGAIFVGRIQRTVAVDGIIVVDVTILAKGISVDSVFLPRCTACVCLLIYRVMTFERMIRIGKIR